MELWGEYIRDGEQDQGNWLEELTRWAEHVASPEYEYHSGKLLTEVNRLKEAMNNG